MADIQISDLTSTTTVTNGVANGTGVFDKLFNTVNLYIDDQYKDGRLKGPEYASVLLGSIEVVLAQSVQFVLQEQMVEAQTKEVLDGTVRANIELNDQLVNTAKDREVKEEQMRGMFANRIVADKQAALLGLDQVVKIANATPESVYTPKYEV